MTPDPDVDLLQRTAAGDRAAFEQLYRTHFRRLFGYIVRMVHDAALAEEVTSDVMVEVWKSAKRFRGASRVSTWMYGIARNKALSARRRPVAPTVDVEQAVELADSADLQDALLEHADVKEAVAKALAQLSAEHQEVMELTFYQGFSYPEIAEILGCPVNTVKTRMFYARQQLKVRLAEVQPRGA